MRWLLFIGRVAFICNLFFVICLLLRHTHFTIPSAFNEFVIIVGWVLSILLNFIFVLSVIILVLRKRNILVPKWVLIVNSFFFIFQVSYRLLFTF
jgi:hypothetical protein